MFFSYKYNGSINKIIKIKEVRFYFTKINNSYCLISLRCPHQGGDIKLDKNKDCLKCIIHGWRFNFIGEVITGGKDLDKIFVKYIDNHIIINNFDFENIFKINNINSVNDKKNVKIKIKLLSHASLLINYKNFNLITDPWLKGLAFNNSWIQYPPPYKYSLKYKPNIILITHEHSDHLSLETLKEYNKNTPIYFPAFPNKRIEKILKRLKFINLRKMYFGKKYNLYKKVYLTCFQPISNFNDSIHLLEFDNFKLLNLNDAGVNYKIAKKVGSVDIISSTFGSGASGYPLCWKDIKKTKKEKILKNQYLARLNLLKNASKIYKAEYILPFASYFALVNKEHEISNNLIFKYKIQPSKIIKEIDIKSKIIDLLPGDEFDYFKQKIIYNNKNRKEIFNIKNINNFLEKKRKKLNINKNININNDKIKKYFESFNNIPEIKNIKNYNFLIEINNIKNSIILVCKIKNGIIKVSFDKKINHDIHIKIPSFIIKNIIDNNMSWDEAYIGYWCEFINEKKFYLDFWKLIHAPYFKINDRRIYKSKSNLLNLPVSYFIKKSPDHSRRIFGFMGMHCLDCDRNTQETLYEASLKHGLNISECNMLVNMLKNYL